MNQGHLALGIILATIGSVIAMIHYRDLAFPNRQRSARSSSSSARSSSSSASTSARPASSSSASASARPASSSSARSSSRRMNVRLKRSNASVTRSQHTNADSPAFERSNVRTLADSAAAELPATLDELHKLTRAIQLHASGIATSKQAALESAWGIRKGASERWRRASQLWDSAMSSSQDTKN